MRIARCRPADARGVVVVTILDSNIVLDITDEPATCNIVGCS